MSTENTGTVAVVKTSGRQYFLTEGQEFEVNRIEGEVGDSISLSDVLLIAKNSDTKVGTPLVTGAKVEASIVRQLRGPKLIIFKKIRRRGKELKKGHRQDLTRLKVTNISA